MTNFWVLVWTIQHQQNRENRRKILNVTHKILKHPEFWRRTPWSSWMILCLPNYKPWWMHIKLKIQDKMTGCHENLLELTHFYCRWLSWGQMAESRCDITGKILQRNTSHTTAVAVNRNHVNVTLWMTTGTLAPVQHDDTSTFQVTWVNYKWLM